ncbi:MAG: phospho-N-acetylmuramoyl-pentapeptide-transferase [Chloroflexi bacterium]|nr:phospho-N-acetylmuramoyl-pentapeptide-transferase [Chloroflexota bacterium]
MLFFLTPMAYSLVTGTIAFLVGVLMGRPAIAFLKAQRIGKQIRIEGPATHMVKTGTPTMGGLIIVFTVLIVTAIFNLPGRLSILLPAGTMVSCGVLGAVDDWWNLVGNRRRGLRARFKLGWQLAIATIAALVLYYLLRYPSYLPFYGRFDIGLWYVPVAIFAIVGASNAVNLTDGLDGLAGYTAGTAFAAYGVIAYLQHQPYVVTFCFTIVGAILAFLWYNAYPAQVFMGDTGSLALGASLAVVAFMTGQWLLLPVVGIVFVAEALSDIVQVTYYKVTGGKRILKMAPLHHHFELLGWSEVQVAQRFWLVGILAAMLGIALALS